MRIVSVIFYVICQKCIYRSIKFRIIECLSNNEVISAGNQGRFWSYGRRDMLHNRNIEYAPFSQCSMFNLNFLLLSFEYSLSRAVASVHESRSAGAAVASMYRNTCGWVSTAGAAPGASSSVIVITVASEEGSLRLGGYTNYVIRWSHGKYCNLQYKIILFCK